MKSRIALLSALTFCLLLSACSKHKENEASAPDTQAQADSAAQAETEAAAEAPPPKMDYWKAVGPLVAGDYSGTCMRIPGAGKVDTVVKVGAAGKASASDLQVDFRDAVKTTLTRQRDDKGQFSAMAMFSVDENKGGTLMLKSDAGGKGTIMFERDEAGVTCSDVPGIDKLHAQPLYLALAGLQLGKKQIASCTGSKNLLARHDTDIAFADGVLKVGDDAYAVKDASAEMFTFDQAGSSVSLSLIMPDSQTIIVSYDGAGKLTGLMTMNGKDGARACDVKQ